jgi:hypothetical protein
MSASIELMQALIDLMRVSNELMRALIP